MRIDNKLLCRPYAWQIFTIALFLMLTPIILSMLKSNHYVIKLSYPLILIFIILWINSGIHTLRLTDDMKKENSSKLAIFSSIIAIICIFTYAFFPHFKAFIFIINICFIYLTIQLSRALAWMDDSKESDMMAIGKYFVLIWLFPIGVWVIQPKMQRNILK